MNSFEIIKTVRLTEKGTKQRDTLNQYTVVADPRANKIQIRQAMQELFKVRVENVNTMNVRGKYRRQRTAQVEQIQPQPSPSVTLYVPRCVARSSSLPGPLTI